MSHFFAELFSRSAYSAELVAGELSGEEGEEKTRRHNEFERFTVAALGFCLEHDEIFQQIFFEKFQIESEGALILVENFEPCFAPNMSASGAWLAWFLRASFRIAPISSASWRRAVGR